MTSIFRNFATSAAIAAATLGADPALAQNPSQIRGTGGMSAPGSIPSSGFSGNIRNENTPSASSFIPFSFGNLFVNPQSQIRQPYGADYGIYPRQFPTAGQLPYSPQGSGQIRQRYQQPAPVTQTIPAQTQPQTQNATQVTAEQEQLQNVIGGIFAGKFAQNTSSKAITEFARNNQEALEANSSKLKFALGFQAVLLKPEIKEGLYPVHQNFLTTMMAELENPQGPSPMDIIIYANAAATLKATLDQGIKDGKVTQQEVDAYQRSTLNPRINGQVVPGFTDPYALAIEVARVDALLKTATKEMPASL